MFTIKFGIAMLYGGGSFVLYALTIIMIRRYWKEYQGSFFKLYIAQFVFNLITFLSSFVTLRVPQNTCKDCVMSFLFKSVSVDSGSWFPLNVFFTFHYSMAFIQYTMILLVALNRFTMIYFPATFERLWDKIFPLTILITVLIPLTQTWPITFNRAYYLFTESLGGYTVKTEAVTAPILSVMLWYMIGACCVTATLSGLSFVRLVLMTTKISTAEKNLLFISLAAFVIQLCACFNTALIFLGTNDSNRTSYWARMSQVILPYVSDVLTISQPYILVIFSKKVRSSMCRLFLGSPAGSGMQNSFANTNNNNNNNNSSRGISTHTSTSLF